MGLERCLAAEPAGRNPKRCLPGVAPRSTPPAEIGTGPGGWSGPTKSFSGHHVAAILFFGIIRWIASCKIRSGWRSNSFQAASSFCPPG